MVSRIACVGGGPGGLFFAALIKQADPSVEVTVFERNRAEDTFGFGVVFSDATLAAIHEADPVLRTALAKDGRHWDDIEVRLKGQRIRCGGNGMAAITRKTLLQLLRRRAEEVGVQLRFSHEVPADPAQLAEYDLIVAADGANSRFRDRLADVLAPEVEVATAKFIWFGTDYLFDGLTFVHEHGPHGTFAVHGYPISDGVSTFIVETDEESWRRAGLDEFDAAQPPGPSDEKSKQYLEKLFADQIDGHELLVNNSRWGNFRTRRTHRWHSGNVVLLGDAAHTAHFSVGSGTKMAMEDAVALADSLLARRDDLPSALEAYEAARRPSVEKIQGSARPSLSWWEHFGRYHDAFEPTQFAFHFISRSIGKERIARRDPEFVEQVVRDWRAAHEGSAPLDTPFRLGEREFAGRRLTAADLAALRAEGCLWLTAPEAEAQLPDAYDQLAESLSGDTPPDLVAVQGGTPFTRSLLAEQSRLVHGVPVLIVEDGMDDDRAETLLLSGRADLVGREQS
ncbi:2-polyprenyl-6-methoxyphenol hydroxylase [Streptomyces sp. MMG1533]|uniref:FAD-dependent monooxygenase n=1 Tax=Streptomyces sp. MMG1533 TaxID=1415546 RepID=UPI0006AF2DB9|nr:FAD-dependent monooxygenase [Streptomyces sp. MMG1533]KOU58133.1 2-polyprenyl-6-methoxyphenol hydroxylase [Streptomyces sp. MMG1533]